MVYHKWQVRTVLWCPRLVLFWRHFDKDSSLLSLLKYFLKCIKPRGRYWLQSELVSLWHALTPSCVGLTRVNSIVCRFDTQWPCPGERHAKVATFFCCPKSCLMFVNVCKQNNLNSEPNSETLTSNASWPFGLGIQSKSMWGSGV